jgi:hypothetical protein
MVENRLCLGKCPLLLEYFFILFKTSIKSEKLLDKMKIGWGYLGGSVKHSEGKGGESVVAISRFLCGSSLLCRLRTDGLVPVSKY